jgi:8-amino-7-oxononanoate synthase
MNRIPESLRQKMEGRLQNAALRELPNNNGLVDFSSNDYLGFAQSEVIFNALHQLLTDRNLKTNGATGSRLISGNHKLYAEAENGIARFHQSESALIFNSGYDANVGFFGCVPQKGDLILYDELCHASIRDGIRLSNAKSYKFAHNDAEDLENLVARSQTAADTIYIVTESVFSMDGDAPPIEKLTALAQKHNCYLVIDEAHALGVFGDYGEGLIQSLQLQDLVFARVVTFGKALGCHGAAVLGSTELKNYLVNFARSFIYTTGLPPHSVAAIIAAYGHLESKNEAILKLRGNINFFTRQQQLLGMKPLFVRSKSAIQSAIIPGNEKARDIAWQLQQCGFDVRAILSPTVPKGQERLRFCIHSHNSETEMLEVLQHLSRLLF